MAWFSRLGLGPMAILFYTTNLVGTNHQISIPSYPLQLYIEGKKVKVVKDNISN